MGCAAAVAVSFGAAPAIADPISVGTDVSSWQHPGGASINWFAVKAAGQQMAMVKATESDWYVNPYYLPDSAAMKLAGLIRGTYHYADPSRSAAAQATFYATTIMGQTLPGDLPPVLDFESSGGLSPSALADWLREFFNTLEATTKRKTIIYTYPNFWNSAMAGSDQFTDHPLWIASYNGQNAPQLPNGWAGWTFWQFTDSGHIDGIPTAVDLNTYNGTNAALQNFANGGAPQLLPFGSSS